MQKDFNFGSIDPRALGTDGKSHHLDMPDIEASANAPTPRSAPSALRNLTPRGLAAGISGLRNRVSLPVSSRDKELQRKAEEQVGRIENSIEAQWFVNEYLQRKWPKRFDPREKLARLLIERMPKIQRPGISEEHYNKRIRACVRAILDVAWGLPGERQYEMLASLVEIAPQLQSMAREVRLETLAYATEAWKREAIDNEAYGEILTTLARSLASSAWPNSQGELRAVLAESGVAWEDGAIDNSGYEEILIGLARSTSSVDLARDEQLLDVVGDEIKKLPPEFQGRPFASLFADDLARMQRSPTHIYACHAAAWAGLETLSPEHAQVGIMMLSGTTVRSEVGAFARGIEHTVVERMIVKIENDRRPGGHCDLHALLMQAMIPIMALDVVSDEALLTRALATIDADAKVSVGDFLGAERGNEAGYPAGLDRMQQKIFDHMYPFVIRRRNERERATELADLAILAHGSQVTYDNEYRKNALYRQFERLADGLSGAHGSLGVPMQFRYVPLKRTKELVDLMPGGWTERDAALRRLRDLGYEHLANFDTAEAWEAHFGAQPN